MDLLSLLFCILQSQLIKMIMPFAPTGAQLHQLQPVARMQVQQRQLFVCWWRGIFSCNRVMTVFLLSLCHRRQVRAFRYCRFKLSACLRTIMHRLHYIHGVTLLFSTVTPPIISTDGSSFRAKFEYIYLYVKLFFSKMSHKLHYRVPLHKLFLKI